MTEILDLESGYAKVHRGRKVAWEFLGAEARLVYPALIPRLDLLGRLDLQGYEPHQAVTASLGVGPILDLVERAVSELLRIGAVVVEDGYLVDPYHDERQAAVPKAVRDREYRERRRLVAETRQGATDRDGARRRATARDVSSHNHDEGGISSRSRDEMSHERDGLRRDATTETETETETESSPECAGPTDFERFWESYPKKRGKRDAEKAWRQTAKDRPPLAEILEAIARLSASWDWRKSGGQYIPYPATWLRAGGWEDDPGPSTAPRRGSAIPCRPQMSDLETWDGEVMRAGQ